MHPPLIKAIAGRRKNERHKGCSEKKNKKGQHQCPICKDYGHHWPSCKKGNPEDIAAFMAERYSIYYALFSTLRSLLLSYC
jgi:hypothetical protein